MDLELSGRTALVTGASKGIGRGIARALAAEGCRVLLAARDTAALEALAQEMGGGARAIPADLSRQAELERVAAEVEDLDILVNNAGAIPAGNLLDVDDARWRAAWDLKVFGYIGLSRALYPALKASGGVIVNIIGSAGERMSPDYIAGSTGNAALMAFTRSLAIGSGKDGIRVVGINPGPVATDRNEVLLRARAAAELGDAGRWQELQAGMPFGRAATVEEIASAAVFLASRRSSYTSGTILTINGAPAG
ncbi:short-chain dehydrogenase/reductase [Roseomonas populi]|uniref:Short-chain dehydrogenase/reductase n=1 Tax=Roseomonas populi TaxID=3121582 RepID=A0ABT1WZ54_9PROT|nr:short-chain dehydrogenase/reductase [Roseomonas pecuniae]MCR0981131.1 short-chain dehydrogenase/reductase [Roseomonas pecuniae]